MYAKDEEVQNNTDEPLTDPLIDQITSRWDFLRTRAHNTFPKKKKNEHTYT